MQVMSIVRIRFMVLLATLILLLSGCSKLTKANYEKIEMGMVKSDIEIVLGPADWCDKLYGTFTCIWGDPDGQHIEIKFILGRASVFSHDGLE